MNIFIKIFTIFTFLVSFAFLSHPSSAQQMTSSNDSDPKAKAMLTKIKKQYDAFKSMEVSFQMDLDLPGQSTEVQKGTVIQQGSKYFIKMKDQDIYSDGKNAWIHLKKNKEVQLTSVDESENNAVISPKQMLSLYENGDYVYTITSTPTVSGKKLTEIEFKPLSKKSDFTKMKLLVDDKSNKVVSLQVFSRDGSKYKLTISNTVTNRQYDSGIFVFDQKKNPGVHIEDLRID